VALVRLQYITIYPDSESRDSSVGIATTYGLQARMVGVRFLARTGRFHVHTASRPALRLTQAPIQGIPKALSLGVKRLKREADHSPPYSAEVNKCVDLYLHSPNISCRGA
jgi:hypothetical protein